MFYYKYFLLGLNSILHPSKNKKHKSLGESISFYYKASFIPLIVSIILTILFSFYFNSISFIPKLLMHYNMVMPNPAFSSAFASISVVLYFIFSPIGFMLLALVYLLVDVILLRVWKGSYEQIVAGLMYGQLVYMILMPLILIPLIGMAIFIIAFFWSIIVMCVSLGAQMKMDPWRAFGGIIVILIILMLIFGSLFFGLFI